MCVDTNTNFHSKICSILEVILLCIYCTLMLEFRTFSFIFFTFLFFFTFFSLSALYFLHASYFFNYFSLFELFYAIFSYLFRSVLSKARSQGISIPSLISSTTIKKSSNTYENTLNNPLSNSTDILTDHERALCFKLLQFPESIERVTRGFEPNYLCSYLYELGKIFNQFYENCRIIGMCYHSFLSRNAWHQKCLFLVIASFQFIHLEMNELKWDYCFVFVYIFCSFFLLIFLGNERVETRLLLCIATRRILSAGLQILHVTSLERI